MFKLQIRCDEMAKEYFHTKMSRFFFAILMINRVAGNTNSCHCTSDVSFDNSGPFY